MSRLADLILILGAMSLLASIEGWPHLPDWMRHCLVGVAAVAFCHRNGDGNLWTARVMLSPARRLGPGQRQCSSAGARIVYRNRLGGCRPIQRLGCERTGDRLSR